MSTSIPARVHADPAGSRNTLLRKILTPTPAFELVGPGASERAQVEALIAEKFRSAWQAEITHYLPWLLSMYCLGSCSAVAGIRPAAGTELFLEQYLDLPAERLLAAVTGAEVQRRHLVEIGNLAATQRGASHLLFLVLAAVLQRAGYRWMVFTATRGLRNSLQKLGFPLLTLTTASPQHLDAAAQVEWGSYYQSEPLVVAGSLDTALQLIDERPLLRRALRLYRHRINCLAASLRGA